MFELMWCAWNIWLFALVPMLIGYSIRTARISDTAKRPRREVGFLILFFLLILKQFK